MYGMLYVLGSAKRGCKTLGPHQISESFSNLKCKLKLFVIKLCIEKYILTTFDFSQKAEGYLKHSPVDPFLFQIVLPLIYKFYHVSVRMMLRKHRERKNEDNFLYLNELNENIYFN